MFASRIAAASLAVLASCSAAWAGEVAPPSPNDGERLKKNASSLLDDAMFADATEVVADAELSEQRGGFRLAGMDIRLGADIKTFLNGELALHTTVQWTENAAVTTQTMSAALTLADAEMLRNNVLATGAITMNVGNDRVYLANSGQTALIHRSDGALQNVLINTASNFSATQEVSATLDLGQYQQFADTITADLLSRSFGGEIGRAITGSLGN